jgi:predicted Holliday junction resolvase-like endonuclease
LTDSLAKDEVLVFKGRSEGEVNEMCFVKGKYPKKSSKNTHEPAGTFS